MKMVRWFYKQVTGVERVKFNNTSQKTHKTHRRHQRENTIQTHTEQNTRSNALQQQSC